MGETNIPSSAGLRPGQRPAFTLIEAMAALLLVAIVLPAAMRAVALATSVSGAAARQQQAVSLAQSKLAELRATGDWRDAALEGDFTTSPSGDMLETPAAAPAFRWNAEVEDWADPALQVLTVRVLYEHRGRQRQVALTTLVPAEEVTP